MYLIYHSLVTVRPTLSVPLNGAELYMISLPGLEDERRAEGRVPTQA